jgi:acetolactate synthase small subunit
LEQVVYFASYIITDVFEDKLNESLKDLEDRFKVSKAEMQKEVQREMNTLKLKKESKEIKVKEFNEAEAMLLKKLDDLTTDFDNLRNLLKTIKV